MHFCQFLVYHSYLSMYILVHAHTIPFVDFNILKLLNIKIRYYYLSNTIKNVIYKLVFLHFYKYDVCSIPNYMVLFRFII